MTETLEKPEPEIQVNLPRFGEFTYKESEVIHFPWGIPGFNEHRDFLLLNLQGQEKFVWLQSLTDTKVALPLSDPWQFFEDYNLQLPLYAVSSLEISQPEDFVTLCVVVVSKDAEEITMNLLAPVIVNLKSKMARQITLEGTSYSVRQPLPRKQKENNDNLE